MSLAVSHDIRVLSPGEPSNPQELMLEARLNLIALEYGYRYRLDIRPKNGPARAEFVRTLREARCVGRPVRRAGGLVLVQFFRIYENGTLKHHAW